MSGLLCAEVIVELPVAQVDRTYHYAIPPALHDTVKPGVRVQVPFGRRTLPGYVVGLSAPPPGIALKEVQRVLDAVPAFTEELYRLARWLAERYLCTTAEALQCVVAPRRGIRERKAVVLMAAGDAAEVIRALARAPKQARAWQVAQSEPGLTRARLAARAGVSESVVDTLLRRGLLIPVSRTLRRNPYPVCEVADRRPRLTTAQAYAVREITRALEAGKREVFLLWGVTGSGKTEVYLRGIEHVLEQGRQAIVTVPEIALTAELVQVFKTRFGERVAVLHSRLGSGERHDEWRRVADGEATVVLGARSAVFAPVRDLGLVVVDEEHETSYKQEDDPKYHLREVAVARARLAGATVVFGSATPSLESFARAAGNRSYRLLTLPHRVDGRPLPEVHIVDLREEHRAGNPRILSRRLQAAIRERLARNEQVILFLNRRGFATVVLCRECGLVMECPHCAIALTYHRGGLVRCHYCNYRGRVPEICPGCGGRALRYFGTGTQRVEDEVQSLFPQAKVVRVDADTAARRRALEAMLGAFREHRADIMIGTQMVAKGLHLPQVTLVGVICADTTLFLPDFRAAERTFQLLTQVAGRAGRGEVPGEVIVQTYVPEHYSITAAQHHDYQAFFRKEIALRRQLEYPPFCALARIIFRGPLPGAVKEAAEACKRYLDQAGEVIVLGPAPAPLAKIKGQYRWHLVLKSKQGAALRAICRQGCATWARTLKKEVAVSIDIDPQSLL